MNVRYSGLSFIRISLRIGTPTTTIRALRLTTNLLPSAIARPVAHLRLLTLRRAERGKGERAERRHRWRGERTNRRRTERRKIDRVLAQGLHLPIDTLTGAGGVRGSAAKQQQRECEYDGAHADLSRERLCYVVHRHGACRSVSVKHCQIEPILAISPASQPGFSLASMHSCQLAKPVNSNPMS